MKEITKLMINEYKIKEIDFMGYKINEKNASFHHLIIPRRMGGLEIKENGAILNRHTSHPYLHTIENIDLDRFMAITSEMVDENIKGYIDMYNIKKINDILSSFEKEYSYLKTKKGNSIIKEEYIKERR